MTRTDLAAAAALVIADLRENEDGLGIDTDAALIAHARNTLRLPTDDYVAGGYPIDDDGTALAAAYIAIVGATPAQITALSLA